MAAHSAYPAHAPQEEATDEDTASSSTYDAASATCNGPASSSSQSLPVPQQLAPCNSGLDNIGNTCFMNSSVTCLANIPALRDYFLSRTFKDHVRVNGLLTVETQGRFAEGFFELMTQVWSGKCSSFRPSRFKSLVERTDERFGDHQQHDSMEFVEFLLDKLREDCNKVKVFPGKKRPYMERQDDNGRPEREVALETAYIYTLRNDGFIDDLFVGFFKSVTICPEDSCRHESFVFDPLWAVPLDLASPKNPRERKFVVTAVKFASGRPERHKIALDRNSTCGNLVEAVAEEAGLNSSRCLLAQVFGGRVSRYIYEDTYSLRNLASDSHLVVYELEDGSSLLDRECSAHANLNEGDQVIVVADFQSDSKNSKDLRRGMLGTVHKVDRDGDALIDFHEFERKQWVYRTHFEHLVDLCSYEERVCPEDEVEYTMMQVAQWDRFKGDTLALLDYWQKDMRPYHEALEAEEKSGCIVHFRRARPGSSDASGSKMELFGLPLLFNSARITTPRRLHDAIGAELAARFGTECRSGWTLYKAPSESSLISTTDVVAHDGDESASEADQLRLSERAYVVVEWGQDAPAQGLESLEEAGEATKDSCVSLYDCFEWHRETDQLEEGCLIRCKGCGQDRQVFKRLELWSLPPVLVIHLKRFEVSPMGGRRRLDTPIRFPLEGLDLRPFCHGHESFPAGECLRAEQLVQIHGLQSPTGQKLNGLQGVAMYLDAATGRFCVRMKEGDPVEEWKRLQAANLRPVPSENTQKVPALPIFDLVGVSNHYGYSFFGHYTSYARSCEDGRWRLYDDDRVKEVSAKEVLSDFKAPYVLFYLRRDLRPASWGPAVTESLSNSAAGPPDQSV